MQSRQRVFWRVRVWDERETASLYSEPASWETGLLDDSDWQADWVGYPAGWSGRALYFRLDLPISKPLRRARAYVAGLGLYELYVNGARADDRVLDPATTDYSKRVLYATYDLDHLIRAGKNTIGVTVGNGWYGMPKLLAQVELEYADGSRDVVGTKGFAHGLPSPWRVTSGPILQNSIYDGETYDATLEKEGWSHPDFPPDRSLPRTESWKNPAPVEPPGGKLVSQVLEPIRIVQELACKSVNEVQPGVFVFDTGQNLAGWAELRVRGARGTKVTLRFAESINSDGTINQENLRKAAATDIYVLKGTGDEVWEPSFTYHGFRYVEVTGYPGRPSLDAIRVKAVRSAARANGDFQSSSDILNRIQKMVWWTESSNLTGIPTDCPQRDERMGWLNDLTVRLEESLYNFNLPLFYTKFLDDVSDTQTEDGAITDTAPYKLGRRPADPVATSYLLMAWQLHLHYGDSEPMRTHYDSFCRWVDFLERKSENGVLRLGHYGDWAPPIEFGTQGSIGAGAVSKDTPIELMSTGYLHYSARLLADMAAVLHKPSDEAKYRAIADRAAEAFHREFWDERIGGYGRNNQAANSFALFLGIVPEERKPRVARNLSADVLQRGTHLTTGNLCTKYLLEMLTENGYADVALGLAQQETYPSWGFMLSHGATTLWERWEYLQGGQMNSHNHPMMGSVSSWFYKYLAGIQPDARNPGFGHATIHPRVPAGLRSAGADYESPYGRFRSHWERQQQGIRFRITVPVNARATALLPAGTRSLDGMPGSIESGLARFELGSGSYEFLSR